MGVPVVLGKLSLLGLTALGVWGTWGLASTNGTFAILAKARQLNRLDVKGSYTVDLRQRWTGIGPFDDLLVALVCFFWPTLDGSSPATTLQSLHFLGQAMSLWTLLYVEALRVGNKYRLVSLCVRLSQPCESNSCLCSITICGLLMENVAIAIVIPLYCLVHLMTSPTASSATQTSDAVQRRNLLVHPSALGILPWSIMIGAGVPTLLMLLSSSTDKSFSRARDLWIILRIYHPLWTFIAHLFLSIVIPPATAAPPGRDREKQVSRALRHVHNITQYVAVIPHIAVISISLASTIAPQCMAVETRGVFAIGNIFRLSSLRTSGLVNSVEEGVAIFLSWDEFVGTISILTWALALNIGGRRGNRQASDIFGTVAKTIMWIAIGGPAAAAVYLIGERDMSTLEAAEVQATENHKD